MATVTESGAPVTERPGKSHRGRHTKRAVFQRTVRPWLAWATVVTLLLTGTALRWWFLSHDGLNADGAGVGLMAQSILHGHFPAFYPGEVYGGAESYVTAGLFLVLGQNALAVSLTPVVLSAVAAILTWRVCRRLVPSPVLAAFAGALVWVAPLSFVWNSTVERGFRGVVMACGLGLLLVVLRICDGHGSWLDYVLLGLLLGIGWWASPEIFYFVVPAAILFVTAIVSSGAKRTVRFWAPRLTVAIAAAVLGASPWLWANIHSGFKSLHTSQFAGSQLSVSHGYGSRLGTFFVHVIPMQLNSVQPVSGLDAPTDPTLHLVLLYGLLTIVVVALALAVLRGGRSLAVVAGLVAFPFIYAAQPGSSFWYDGRYGVFLVPLLAMTVVMACDELSLLMAGRLSARQGSVANAVGQTFAILAAILFGALSVIVLHEDVNWFDPATHQLSAEGGNPEAPTLRSIAVLERAGVHFAYADYWVAYNLDFLSGGRLAVTTKPPDQVIEATTDQAVRKAHHVAWLFVPRREKVTGYWQFGETTQIAGPAGMSEASFVAQLRSRNIGYRTVRAGVLDAVIPNRAP